MPTRRLSYKSDIWVSYLETHKNCETSELPPIIDIHFYTGSKPYNGPLCLADLAPENKKTINQCLTEPMLNIWAGDLSEEQLKTHPWAAIIEFIMMNRKTNDLRTVLKKIAPNSMVEKAKIEAKLESKLEIAMNMLAENAAPLFVAKVTKLPLNKIKELKNKHH